MMPLAEVEAGSTVRLDSVDAGQGLQARLVSMGLIPGTEIEVVRNDTRGPFIIGVKGTRLMLGRGVVERIAVS